jgi:hypothetical protein
MASSHSSYIDARGSNFNNIGGDQNVVFHLTVVNNLPLQRDQHTAKRRLHDRNEIQGEQKRPKTLRYDTPYNLENDLQWSAGSIGNFAELAPSLFESIQETANSVVTNMRLSSNPWSLLLQKAKFFTELANGIPLVRSRTD